MGHLDQVLHTYLLKYCPTTVMQNGDDGLTSIILAGRGLLGEMFVTLELHCIL